MATTVVGLVDLWNGSREIFEGKLLRQVIAFAGSGKLRHENDTSHQFRAFLHHVPSDLLITYANECLIDKFPDSGFALQDIVNQIGRRLGFDVVDGRYTGVAGSIGFDGLWRAADGHSIVVEVKTTDAFSINLDTIAGYRKALSREQAIDEDRSSILIVCGRDDTGNLESQVRGSRHAWDIRLISIDALLRLMQLKERLEDPDTIRKIRDVLVPREFTKVDGIIDLVFSTAEEVRQVEPDPALDSDTQVLHMPDGTPEPPANKIQPAKFHDACIQRIQASLGNALIRQSQSTFTSADKDLTVICLVSKQHGDPDSPAYWFAFHPHQKELLQGSNEGFMAFGCGSPEVVLLIPSSEFIEWLDGFWITQREDRFYWHVRIRRQGDMLSIDRKHGYPSVDVSRYRLGVG